MEVAPDYLNDLNDRVLYLRKEVEKNSEPSEQLPLLDELSFHLALIDPVAGEEAASQQLQIAESIGDKKWMMRGWIRLANNLTSRSMNREGRAALEEAWRLLDELPDNPAERAYICRNIGKIDCEDGETEKAMQMFKASVEYGRQSGDEREIGATLGELGSLYAEMGLYKQAIEVLKEALESHRARSFLSGEVVELMKIGSIFAAIEDWDQALEYYYRGLEEHQSIGNKSAEAQTYLEIGTIYLEQQKFEEAERIYKHAQRLSVEIQNPAFQVLALKGVAHLRRLQGEYGAGAQYLEKATHMFDVIESVLVKTEILVELGELSITRGDWNRAIECLSKAEKTLAESQFQSRQVKVQQLLARAYEGNKNVELSLQYYKNFISTAANIFNQKTYQAIAQYLYDDRIKNKEKIKKNLEKASDFLEEKEQVLIDEESKQLSLVDKQQSWLDQIKEQLCNLHQTNEHLNLIFNRIVDEMKNQSMNIDLQKLFESYVKRSNPEFFHQLEKKYPALTFAEKQICYLLKINLSTKEVSALLRVSIRTVETHRKRIRKKIGLQRRDSLVVMMNQI